MDSRNWRKLLQEELGAESDEGSRLLETAKTAFLHQYQEQLTDIQRRSIAAIHAGKNALLVSATASGKTEAVAIPIAAKLIASGNQDVCLYIAPTRALLNDLHERMMPALHRLGVRYAVRHGDRKLTEKDSDLQILFTTPESLDVLMCKDAPFLRNVRYGVVDEIHQIYGTPRGAQLKFLLERVQFKSGHPLQRVALSATVGDKRQLASWFGSTGGEVQIFATGRHRDIVADIHWIQDIDDLGSVLRSLDCKKVLVFVNSRRQCDDAFVGLRDLSPYRVFVHYSTLDSEQREYVERHFRLSEFAICTATSTLELGIDIGSVDGVILVSPPWSVGSLLQRIGRGNRRTGTTRAVMTAQTPLKLLQFCAATTLARKGLLEQIPGGQFYSVLIQQIFSMVAAKHHHRIHRDEVSQLSAAFEWIQPDDQAEILAALDRKDYLEYEPEWHSYRMGRRLATRYNRGKIYSNIVGGAGGVPVFYEGRRLAYLPLAIPELRLGRTILFAGRYWEITSIADDGVGVRLGQPVPDPIQPMWGGGGTFGIDGLLARQMKRALIERDPFSQFDMDPAARERLSEIYERVPGDANPSQVFVDYRGHQCIHYTFAGAIENSILQLAFWDRGYECRLARRAVGIALTGPEPMDFSSLPTSPGEIRTLVEANWHALTDGLRKGPFFHLLPARVKKKEVLSQVITEERVAHLESLSRAKKVTASLQLLD